VPQEKVEIVRQVLTPSEKGWSAVISVQLSIPQMVAAG